VKRKSRFIGKSKKKLITKTSRRGGKITKKKKDKFRAFVMTKFFQKMPKKSNLSAQSNR